MADAMTLAALLREHADELFRIGGPQPHPETGEPIDDSHDPVLCEAGRYLQEAADALDAKDAEIERLRSVRDAAERLNIGGALLAVLEAAGPTFDKYRMALLDLRDALARAKENADG